MFDGKDVRRGFDNAEGASVAFGVGADEAEVGVADVAAFVAALRGVQRVVNGVCQLFGFLRLVKQEAQRHALRGFVADAGQAGERLHQLVE